MFGFRSFLCLKAAGHILSPFIHLGRMDQAGYHSASGGRACPNPNSHVHRLSVTLQEHVRVEVLCPVLTICKMMMCFALRLVVWQTTSCIQINLTYASLGKTFHSHSPVPAPTLPPHRQSTISYKVHRIRLLFLKPNLIHL